MERSLLYAIERKRVEDTIKRLAYHDPLTGLPSRALFTDRFMMAKQNSKRYSMKIALIMLDFDHFKDINDNFGHDAGDELLKEMSSKTSVTHCARLIQFAVWDGMSLQY